MNTPSTALIIDTLSLRPRPGDLVRLDQSMNVSIAQIEGKMAEFNFEFNFDNEDEFTPTSFQDNVEKQKLREFEQTLQAKDFLGRHDWISVCAYYKAEKRGFEPGFELDDWLEAEHELLEQKRV